MRSLRVVAGLAAFVTASALITACASSGVSPVSAASAASATPIAGAIAVADAPFVASLKSKKFYPAACQTVKLIKAADQVGFASIAAAEKAGFAKDVYSTDCRY